MTMPLSPVARPASIAMLVALVLAAAIHELWRADWTWIPGGMALFGFLLLEWRRLAPAAQRLAAIVIALGTGLPLANLIPVDTLHKALDQALYLGFFVTALGVLQDTAAGSPLIRRAGTVLLSQPPGRRYSVLTAGGALMGVLLNLGALSLLGTMIAQANESLRAETGDRIAGIRLRRMSLAVLRGFCTVPLWSPTSMSMPLVFMALPSLTFLDILPVGGSIALALLTLGWMLDRMTYPRRPQAAQPPIDLSPLVQLLGLVLLIPALGLGVATALDIRSITAILLIVPCIALAWQWVQQRGFGTERPLRAARQILLGRTLPSLPDLRSEITIFAASGALGILLMPLVDVELLGALVHSMGLGKGMVLAAGFLFISGMSFLGLNPIVSVTLVMGVYPRIPGFSFEPIHLAMMALCGWSVAVGLSPLSASVRIAARSVGVEAAVLGLRWNRSYGVAATLLLTCAMMLTGEFG